MKLVVFRSLGKSDFFTFGSRTVISARSSTRARAAEVFTFTSLKRDSAYVVCVMIQYQSPKSLFHCACTCISYIISQLHEWSIITAWDICFSPCRIFITLAACISCAIANFPDCINLVWCIEVQKASWCFIMTRDTEGSTQIDNLGYTQNIVSVPDPLTHSWNVNLKCAGGGGSGQVCTECHHGI